MACLVPFLEHEFMDTLGYIVASALANFPASLHKDIVDLLCNHLLPVTISEYFPYDISSHRRREGRLRMFRLLEGY